MLILINIGVDLCRQSCIISVVNGDSDGAYTGKCGFALGTAVVLLAKWQILLEMAPEYGAEVGFLVV